MELKEMSRQSHMASKGLHLRAKLLYSLSVKVDQMIPKVPALVWSPEKQREWISSRSLYVILSHPQGQGHRSEKDE